MVTRSLHWASFILITLSAMTYATDRPKSNERECLSLLPDVHALKVTHSLGSAPMAAKLTESAWIELMQMTEAASAGPVIVDNAYIEQQLLPAAECPDFESPNE